MLVLAGIPAMSLAEGSKELTSNGGNRAYLVSSVSSNYSFPFPTLGTMKVYVKAGETIYLGSSAQGMGLGTINLRAPDGSTYASGSSATVGRINNRSQELAGPLPASGGYQPYKQLVAAGQEGIWEIDFISPVNGTDQSANPPAVAANESWTQPNSQYIAAFDVSVRNSSNTAFVKGRVFTNILSGILGSFTVGINAVLHILTKDGYQYTFDNNGQAGNGFTFFVNNKGFRKADGSSLYQSLNTTTSPNVQDPRSADTQSDITQKIFFNTPSTDLPATALTPSGGSTWLYNAPVAPTVSAVNFTGTEGTAGKGGTSPLGGNFNFASTANGKYTISIDVNGNGVYTDAIDRQLTGPASAGANQVHWDGLDGQGNKVPASNTAYNSKLSITLFAAEVHFPFFDVERNVNGIKLTRTNGANAPESTIYWDDSPITVVGTPSNPITNLTGISSLVNGHKWGTPTNSEDDNDFGNNKSIDTWTYASVGPLTALLSFTLRESDLEVVSISSTTDCASRKLTYTVAVRNNGPTDVTGSKFAFSLPDGFNSPSVSNAQTSGNSTITTTSTSPTQYNATLNMANGAIRTFTITGEVGALTSAKTFTVTAAMLRPADVTDPDATNADAAAPADASAECSAQSSGSSCNNIKTNTTVVAPVPDAGADQVVVQNTVVTLTGNADGAWTQVGTTPVQAHITSPSSGTTTVTGLTTIGAYTFQFTNNNGCSATVTINVFSSDIYIPNIITPNGDGKNDVFDIKGLNYYPNSQLLIFNRWGNEVYRSDNYLNNWDGSGLAEGTYYYILNRKEASGSRTAFKGWVYLKR